MSCIKYTTTVEVSGKKENADPVPVNEPEAVWAAAIAGQDLYFTAEMNGSTVHMFMPHTAIGHVTRTVTSETVDCPEDTWCA